MPIQSSQLLALPAGTQIQRYQIERQLGRKGGTGFTYLATDLHLKCQVALKELFPSHIVTRSGRDVVLASDLAEDLSMWRWSLRKFKEEAQHLARFRHPKIVAVSALIEANQTAYIVMNYVEGWSFDQFLDHLGRPPTEHELRHVFHQILDGLDAVHRENILHRDVKPSNIYMTKSRQVVLLDFGAARLENRPTTSQTTYMPQSHGYSPLEQCQTVKPLTFAADIYSVAATMVRSLTGAAPPEAKNRNFQDAYVPMAVRCADRYTPALLQAIDAGMALHAENRPQTVAQWRRMLEPGRVPPRPSVSPRPPGSVDPRWVIGLLASMLLVLGLVALWLCLRQVWGTGHGSNVSFTEITPQRSALQQALNESAEDQRRWEAALAARPTPKFAEPADSSPASSPPPAALSQPKSQPTPPPQTPVVTATPTPAPSAAPASDPIDLALTELAKTDIEDGVRPEHYAAHVFVNDSGKPGDTESKNRMQFVADEEKDNAVYSSSLFVHLNALRKGYDKARDVATIQQLFLYDRVRKADGQRKLGIVVRTLQIQDASTTHRRISQRIVETKTTGYRCRLSLADHLTADNKNIADDKPKQTYGTIIKRIIQRDRNNFETNQHRDLEDERFEFYHTSSVRSKIVDIASDSLLVAPMNKASLDRIVRETPVLDVVPSVDGAALVLYIIP